MGRKILIGLTGLLLLSLGFGFLYLRTADWNQYRGILSESIAEHSDFDLSIDGDMQFSLLPQPVLTAAGVTLSNKGGQSDAAALATADKVRLRLSLSALLQRQIRAREIIIEGLRVEARQEEDGGWPGEALWQGDGLGDDQPLGGWFLASINRVRIAQSTVLVSDLNGHRTIIDIDRLDLNGQAGVDVQDIKADFALDGSPFSVSVRIQPTLKKDSIALRGDVAVSGGALSVSGRVSPNALSARLSGAGDNAGRFLEALSKLSAFPLEGEAPTPFAFDASLSHEYDSLSDFFGGTYALTLRQIALGKSRTRADLKMAYDRAAKTLHVTGGFDAALVVPEDLAAISVIQKDETASVSTGPMITGQLGIRIAALELGDERIRQITSDFDLKGGQIDYEAEAILPGATKITSSGTLAPGGDIWLRSRLEAQSGQFQTFLTWLDADKTLPIAQMDVMTASLQGDLAIDSADGWMVENLTGRLDSDGVAGSLAGDFNDPAPARVTLDLDRLRVGAPCLHPQCWRGASDHPILLDLTVDRLETEAIALQKFVFKAALEKNAVNIKSVEAEVYQAGVSPVKIKGQGRFFQADDERYHSDSRVEAMGVPLFSVMGAVRQADTRLFAADLSLDGPLDDLTFGLIMEDPGGRYQAAGRLMWQAKAFVIKAIQGTFVDEDWASLATHIWPNAQNVEAMPVALSVSSDQVGGDFFIDIAGQVADFQTRTRVQVETAGLSLAGDTSQFLVPAVEWSSLVVEAEASEFYDFAPLFGHNVPGFDGDLSATMSFQLERGAAGLFNVSDARLTQGASELEANLTLNFKDQTLGGRLSITGLTLTRPSPAGGELGDDSDGFLPSGWTGEVQISTNDVLFLGQILGVRNTPVRFDGASLVLPSVRGTMNGKAADLSGRYSPVSGGVTELTLSAESLAVAPLLADFGYAPLIESTGPADIALTGSGKPGATWLESASGTIKLTLAAGTITPFDAEGLIDAFQRSQSEAEFLGLAPLTIAEGRSTIEGGDLSLRLEEGVFLLDRFEARGRWGTVTADGQINIPARFMRVTGGMVPDPNTGLPGVPFGYEGSIENPRVSFDLAALTAVGRRRYDQRRIAQIRQGLSSSTRNPMVSLMLTTALSRLRDYQSRQMSSGPRDQSRDNQLPSNQLPSNQRPSNQRPSN